jgi:predicted nuclease of predicted toxin-antitoxin system
VKLLLDENLSHRLVPRVIAAFPDTTHVDTLGLRGRPDQEIWEYAGRNGFVLVSKDDDFRQLAFLRGHPPKVVRLLVGNAGTAAIADLLLENLERIKVFVDNAEDALLTIVSHGEDSS